MAWLVLVMGIFSHLGVMQTQFMSFGPSPQTFFMGIRLDSWYRWTWVAIFTFLSTAINDFVGDAVVPWIQNTVQDHKSRYIPYSKFTCWGITQCWSLYCCAMSVFSIYLLMSQIDFLIIRAVADAIVNTYTTYRFLRGKKTNPTKYARWYARESAESDSESGEAVEERVEMDSVTIIPASEVLGEPQDPSIPVATALDIHVTAQDLQRSEEVCLVNDGGGK